MHTIISIKRYYPDRFVSDSEQQKIAREINFSETAFIFPKDEKESGYPIRIWTPNVGEVPFAGHPSLGAAYVIHNYIEHCHNKTIFLNLNVGQIPVTFSEGNYIMKQNPPTFDETISAEDISCVFGIHPSEIRADLPIQLVSTGLDAVIVPLKEKKALSKISVNKNSFNEYIKVHTNCNCNHLFFVDMGNNTFSARCIM